MKFPNLPFNLHFSRRRDGIPDSSAIRLNLRTLYRTIVNVLQAAGLKNKADGGKSFDSLPTTSSDESLRRGFFIGRRNQQANDLFERETIRSRYISPTRVDADAQASSTRGTLLSRSHTGRAGTRSYKLFLPATTSKEPMPLVVMLHGCRQSPDDFAAGTRMMEMAESHGFLVAYPEQAANANGSKCWNWYRAQDQSRDTGEPSLIAGITRDIVRSFPIDMKRVFVAGLSAGGAMAVILGRTYPDLFAAVGVHSGLPYGAAHDVKSAIAAMKIDPGNALFSASPTSTLLVPTIVFHGDFDATVNVGNGTHIVAQTVAQARRGQANEVPLQATEYAGSTTGGKRYTRTVYRDRTGRPLVEGWLVHGGGHVWSGGSNSGSYTDPTGPDASEAMIHFFLAQEDASMRDHPQ